MEVKVQFQACILTGLKNSVLKKAGTDRNKSSIKSVVLKTSTHFGHTLQQILMGNPYSIKPFLWIIQDSNK